MKKVRWTVESWSVTFFKGTIAYCGNRKNTSRHCKSWSFRGDRIHWVLVLPSHQEHSEDGEGVSPWNVGEILTQLSAREHFIDFKTLRETLQGRGVKLRKGIPRQAEVALGVPGRLRPRIFSTFGTTRVVGRQPNAPAAFTPGEIPGTHFQRLSRPQGTWFCRKESRNKSQVTPPGSIPGPSD